MEYKSIFNKEKGIWEYRGHEYYIPYIPPYKRPSDYPKEYHKEEQIRIDRLIEEENKPKKEVKYEDTADYGFDWFMKNIDKL